MEIFLLIVGILCLLVGLAGAVLPLPGPSLSFLGLIALKYSEYGDYSTNVLWTFGLITLAVTVLDYFIPIWGTKKFGGSKWGMIGSGVGLVVGLFFGPWGMFVGAFLGAFAGEYFYMKDQNVAFRAAVGSFIGLMVGIVMKVILCLAMLVYASIQIVKDLWPDSLSALI